MTRRRPGKPRRPGKTPPPPPRPTLAPLRGDRTVGAWADPDANAGRHYTPDQLGRLCPVCRSRMPAALDHEHTHPCCGPDANKLLTLSRAARRRHAHTSNAGSPQR